MLLYILSLSLYENRKEGCSSKFVTNWCRKSFSGDNEGSDRGRGTRPSKHLHTTSTKQIQDPDIFLSSSEILPMISKVKSSMLYAHHAACSWYWAFFVLVFSFQQFFQLCIRHKKTEPVQTCKKQHYTPNLNLLGIAWLTWGAKLLSNWKRLNSSPSQQFTFHLLEALAWAPKPFKRASSWTS